MSSSPLQGGLPTDRLVAEWWLDSERVRKVLAGERPELSAEEQIDVPASIYDWKKARDPRAKNVQSANRGTFQRSFAEGLTVLGYERDSELNGKFMLGRWDIG